MNEAMKKENIEEYIKSNELDLELNQNFLYAQIDAKLWKYALFQAAAVLDISHLLLFFGEKELTIVGLTTVGNFTSDVFSISYDQISDFKFKKGMLLQSTLSFLHKKEKYIFKIPNVVLVAKWQKENLNYLQREGFIPN
ncbi:hypothetical protein I6N96_12405 [Enterococcus sp. BWM-S5]|uniref:YokE-like PH domain-containing protein n=2 Tax=Enterococcus larvae TaxID=2794352 RepID=A0ABS4CKR2_9ENTE|nr:hypothetical protein [Enterococcus larvae]